MTVRQILISTPSVALAIGGFLLCLFLLWQERRTLARQEREQRFRAEVERHKKKAALDVGTSKTAAGDPASKNNLGYSIPQEAETCKR